MRAARIFSFIGTITMAGAISWAFLSGSFSDEGSKLLSIPWGIVSLVDLYVGFILFSIWIIYREKSIPLSVLWIILMLTLGFFTGSLYTFLALQKSNGVWKRFWLGKHYVN